MILKSVAWDKVKGVREIKKKKCCASEDEKELPSTPVKLAVTRKGISI